MANLVILFIYLIQIAIILYLLLFKVKTINKKLAFNMYFFGIMVLCCIIVYTISNLVENPSLSYYIREFDNPFLAFSIIGFFLFLLRFFSYDYYYIPSTIMLLLIVPFVTLFICIFQAFYFINLGLPFDPKESLLYFTSPYYLFFLFWCACIIVLTLFLVLTQCLNPANIYKKAIVTLTLGYIISLTSFILFIGNFISIDLNSLSLLICYILTYIAIRDTKGLDFLYNARKSLYNELDEKIIIIGKNNQIISTNLSAKYMLYKANISTEETSFDIILSKLFKDTHIMPKNKNNIDYYMHDNSGSIINIVYKDIMDGHNNKLATIAIFNDVSDSRRVLNDLKLNSGIDPITGLFIKENIHRQINKFGNITELLPITIIVSKFSMIENNTMQTQTDTINRIIAETLLNACPPTSRISHLDKNKILILIPHFTANQCQALMNDLRKKRSVISLPSYEINITYASTVKRTNEYDIHKDLEIAEKKLSQND